jgi:hypothetical protein
MNATLFYRTAGVLFVLFTLGHTFGFLSFRPASTEGQAVFESMSRVRFDAGGRSASYADWYRGFGLSITVSMLFWAFLSWHLGELAKAAPHAIGVLGWAFFVVQLAGAVMALLYFGPPAVVLSTLSAALVGIAAWLTPR